MRFFIAAVIALLPSFIKIPIYRLFFGYTIGKRVRIGLSPIAYVPDCRIDDDVRIGHGNLFLRVDRLEIGRAAEIGFGNVFRGGKRITLGSYVSVLRFNTINAIPEPDVVNEIVSECEIGDGAVVTANHWIDFTDRVRIGACSILGGRNSSIWTHNRQRTRPVDIGAYVYLGSEVRIAPGTAVGDCCIVQLGSVLVGRFEDGEAIIGGNPAARVRPLSERDLILLLRKTRNDVPDLVAAASLPMHLRGAFDAANSLGSRK